MILLARCTPTCGHPFFLDLELIDIDAMSLKSKAGVIDIFAGALSKYEKLVCPKCANVPEGGRYSPPCPKCEPRPMAVIETEDMRHCAACGRDFLADAERLNKSDGCL